MRTWVGWRGVACGLSAAVAVAPAGLAATPPHDGQPPAAQLDRIVVTATRRADDALLVPAAVDVVDGDDLHRARPEPGLSDALQRVPGVVARERQNQAQGLQVSVRGFGARSTFGIRGVRLYSDGIPATMPDGQGQISHFLVDSAARIEVLRGPFSALYGNSSGGVVLVTSPEPPAEPQLSTGLAAGRDGLRQLRLSWHAPWAGDGAGGILVDSVRTQEAGFRDHSASRQATAQAVLKGGFGQGGQYSVVLNAHDLRADDPQGLTAAQLRGDRRSASAGALAFDTRKAVRQQQAGMHLAYPLSGQHALEATAFAGVRETTQMLSIPEFVQADPRQGGGAIALDRDYGGVDLRWRWTTRWLGRAFSLVAGAEYGSADERRRGYENFVGDRRGVFGALRRDEDDRVTARDGYVQASWQPADRWRVDLGVRHSQVQFASRDDYVTADNPDDSGRLRYARTSPVAGVLFRMTPRLSLYANAGTGFETPTFSEIAYRPDGASGLNTLRAARSRNAEIGLRGRGRALAYSAALFSSRTRGELVATGNEGGRSVYGNAGQSRRRGLEFSASGSLSSRWHYAAAYTFIDARYVDDFNVCGPSCQAGPLIRQGQRIPGLSRHAAWAELRRDVGSNTDLVFDGRFADRVPVDDGNDASAPTYAVFSLAAERRFDAFGLHWRASARLDNLFDRRYVGSVIVNEANGRYYEPAPGRGWTFGLQARRTFD